MKSIYYAVIVVIVSVAAYLYWDSHRGFNLQQLTNNFSKSKLAPGLIPRKYQTLPQAETEIEEVRNADSISQALHNAQFFPQKLIDTLLEAKEINEPQLVDAAFIAFQRDIRHPTHQKIIEKLLRSNNFRVRATVFSRLGQVDEGQALTAMRFIKPNLGRTTHVLERIEAEGALVRIGLSDGDRKDARRFLQEQATNKNLDEVDQVNAFNKMVETPKESKELLQFSKKLLSLPNVSPAVKMQAKTFIHSQGKPVQQ